MGWGSGNLGGGSAGLNFKVVGNPQPTSPKGNTIWLNTDEPNPSYIFSPVEPTSLADGAVWIQTGSSSPVAFNALKKNGIMLCPLSAKQRIGGVLTAVETKIWQNGEWVDFWNGTLFDNGDQFEGITGGWINGNGEQATESTLTADYYYAPSTAGPYWRTKNKVDLTDYSSLKAHFTEASGSFMLRVATDTTQSSAVLTKTYPGYGDELACDIADLVGEYYVFLATTNSGVNNFAADKVRLE